MTYVNGADHGSTPPVGVEPVMFGDEKHALATSPERWLHIRKRLIEPFDPGEIKGRAAG